MTEVAIFLGGTLARVVVSRGFNNWLDNSERRMAIWNHYVAQAKGSGHDKLLETCTDEKCAEL